MTTLMYKESWWITRVVFTNWCFIINWCLWEVRGLCLEYDGLDPEHYFRLLNFAWDAMLLKTGVVLEPLTHTDMFEKGVRGGMNP